jgi:cysteinyl-tRNA synthetase
MTLLISNTLSGRKEPFQPRGSVVTMYVCGMTPKFHPHVGHARLFVATDVIRRYLEYRGYEVKHVQNFTDIDDKIIERGQLEGTSPEEAAAKYTLSYHQAMQALGVTPPHLYPTVTTSMGAIVDFVQALVEQNTAYVVAGDVYFAVERFPDYGKLSRRTAEGQLVGARKELEPGKRDPRDFALWKAAKPGEPSWDSPWGKGRPGWHIECSTMVRETLGEQIDIHSGGRDLIFPHHENEIAQSEARTNKVPFARYWPHVGLVTTGGEKMSHSLANFTTVHDILAAGHDPMALRLYLLSTHYRAPLAFSQEGLVDKTRALDRLRVAATGAPESTHTSDSWAASYREKFVEAMDDDFNTAAALAVLFDLAREINRRRDGPTADLAAGQALFLEVAAVLGLDLKSDAAARIGSAAPFLELLESFRERLAADDQQVLAAQVETALASARPGDDQATAEPLIELLLELRNELREAHQWALADRIRDELRARSVLVEDQAGQSVWRWAR